MLPHTLPQNIATQAATNVATHSAIHATTHAATHAGHLPAAEARRDGGVNAGGRYHTDGATVYRRYYEAYPELRADEGPAPGLYADIVTPSTLFSPDYGAWARTRLLTVLRVTFRSGEKKGKVFNLRFPCGFQPRPPLWRLQGFYKAQVELIRPPPLSQETAESPIA
eukprot:352616-Chlamydomonas_euryale.AAC.19